MNLICIDVGSPKNIGWANNRDQTGSARTLLDELHRAGRLLLAGERVALGFKAPIWTPRRAELERITASRGGVEKSFNRAWSAGAGCGALGAALALMPWCFATLRETSGSIAATTDPVAFASGAAPLPVALVTDERIEMTDWELHDFAVQIVRGELQKDGKELMSWTGNPAVDPAIWFVGDTGPEWIVVRAAR